MRIEIICHPEEASIKGNVSATGDDTLDKEMEDRVRGELEEGNEWAWCCVEIRVFHGDIYGSSFLGCCSYENEADFRNSDYYEDMVAMSDWKYKFDSGVTNET